MRPARTWDWPRMHRYDDLSNDPDPSSPRQFCPDYIIATPGYDFQEEHRLPSVVKCRGQHFNRLWIKRRVRQYWSDGQASPFATHALEGVPIVLTDLPASPASCAHVGLGSTKSPATEVPFLLLHLCAVVTIERASYLTHPLWSKRKSRPRMPFAIVARLACRFRRD
jgi:hypothetical protein